MAPTASAAWFYFDYLKNVSRIIFDESSQRPGRNVCDHGMMSCVQKKVNFTGMQRESKYAQGA